MPLFFEEKSKKEKLQGKNSNTKVVHFLTGMHSICAQVWCRYIEVCQDTDKNKIQIKKGNKQRGYGMKDLCGYTD